MVERSRSTTTTQVGSQSDDATATIVVDRADLERVMLGEITHEELFGSGTAAIDGTVTSAQRWLGSLVEFDLRFELLPTTASSG